MINKDVYFLNVIHMSRMCNIFLMAGSKIDLFLGG